MNTDNRTNGLTAEQILVDEWIRQADRAKSMTGMDAIWFPDAEETLAVLRANGLLFEGTPSEAQVEAAAKVLAPDGVFAEDFGEYSRKRDNYRREDQAEEQRYYMRKARAALVAAASVAPAVRPSSGVDVETLANLIHSTSVAHFGGLDPRVAPIIARALCEAAKRGELS